MKSNKSISRKNKKRSPYTKQNHSAGKEISYTLPRNRTIVPDSYITNLRFCDSSHTTLNNALSNFASIRFRPSAAYDIDPVLASTAVPGFNELAGLYGRYRVLQSTIRVNFTNLEKFPIQTFIWPTNFDLGANYSLVAAAIASPYAKSRTISPSGGIDHAILRQSLETAQVFGTDEVLFDDQFAAGIATTPANNWFWNIGLWSPTAALNAGVMTLIEIDIQVQFTERIQIVN